MDLKKKNKTIFNGLLVFTNLFNLMGVAINNPLRELAAYPALITSIVGLANPNAEGINKAIPITSLISSFFSVATSIGTMFHDFVSDKTDATSKYINNWHPEYTFGRFAHKCLRNINRVGRLASSIASSVMSIMALAQNLTMSSPIMQALSWLNIGTFIFNQLSAVTWWGSNIAGGINSVVKDMKDDEYMKNLPKKVRTFNKEELIDHVLYSTIYLTVTKPNQAAEPNISLKDYLLGTDPNVSKPFRPVVNAKKDEWSKDFNILENTWNFLSR
jgi:hypothetical protein